MVSKSMVVPGEERAQRAALLALITICCAPALCAGCRHDPTLAVPRHSVRISALLTLHPAWAQVQRLTGALDEVAPPSVEPRFTPVQLSAPFTPPAGLPPSRVADHEKIVHEDAARYIAQLESSLATRNRELTEAKKHAADQLARTQYNTALEKQTGALRDAAVVQARVLQQQLNQLNYRLEALASQSRVYASSGFNARRLIDDVRLQQGELDRRVQLKNTEVTGVLKADFKGLAENSLKGLKQSLDVEAANEVSQFQLQQSHTDGQEIAEARARVDAQPTPIPALMDHSGEISNPGAAALIQAVGVPDNSVFTRGDAERLRAARVRTLGLRSEIDRLTTIITADTRKAVEEIARKEQWIVAPEGAAADWTSRVAEELRAHWGGLNASGAVLR